MSEYFIPEVFGAAPPPNGGPALRKQKPIEVAVITEDCTGCGGSPACVPYCPVPDCMVWFPDQDNPPLGRIAVNPRLCTGCKLCASKGPEGSFLDGCPWDAIEMAPIEMVEAMLGTRFER